MRRNLVQAFASCDTPAQYIGGSAFLLLASQWRLSNLVPDTGGSGTTGTWSSRRRSRLQGSRRLAGAALPKSCAPRACRRLSSVPCTASRHKTQASAAETQSLCAAIHAADETVCVIQFNIGAVLSLSFFVLQRSKRKQKTRQLPSSACVNALEPQRPCVSIWHVVFVGECVAEDEELWTRRTRNCLNYTLNQPNRQGDSSNIRICATQLCCYA
jgi:hypothetical protein